MNDTDVLIVGAGPTGLTLANELVRRGVKCRLVEKNPAPSDKSKALAVQSRTLEVFHAMDALDRLLEVGYRAGEVHLFHQGRKFAGGRIEGLHGVGAPYPWVTIVSQEETEKALIDALAKRGFQVERRVEAKTFVQDADGVTTTLVMPDGRSESVRSRYIVGCDGAHSMVRHTLGVPFVGDAYHNRFLLADVQVDWDFPRGSLLGFLGPVGVCAWFPFDDDRFGRLIIVDHVSDEDHAEPTLDTIRQAVKFYVGKDVPMSNPRWIARFRLHHRCAERYADRRAFLAGDAAHIHSPAGGQGMNTGIQDAFNLGWKLAVSLQRQAPRSLLDSYHAERHPIGTYLMERTDRAFALMSSGKRLLGFLRNTVARLAAPVFFRSLACRDRGFRTISQIGIRYVRSPIVAQTRAGEGKRAGERAPQVAFASGGNLFDALRDGAFHWVGVAMSDAEGWRAAASAASRGLPVTCHVADVGEGPRLYGKEPASYLVRPDGHVAFKTYGGETAAAVAHFRATYGGA